MNHMNHSNTVRPRSFLGTLALGVTCVVTTGIICVTGAAVYGMRVIEKNADNIFALTHGAISDLPELAKSLPPALADLLNDRRMPNYAEELDVSVALAATGDRVSPVVRVENRGTQLVSLLSLRVVIVDEDGRPVAEHNEWAATPLAADHDWRGPLMPGASRSFATGGWRLRNASGDLHAEVEITDVRVWQAQDDTRAVHASAGR